VNPSKRGVFLKKANGERVKANTVPSIVFKTTAGVETMTRQLSVGQRLALLQARSNSSS